MNEIFISIITVCYNSKTTIGDTLESIFHQSFDEYEHIIVDGASTDGTIDIIKEWANRSSHIRWISEKDKGIYNAMNKGIMMAKGKYIWIVNSDDWAENNSLRTIYEYLSASPTQILCGWTRIVDADKNEQYVIKSNKKTFDRGINKLKLGISHPATVVSREVYESIGLFDETYYITSDVDFILRAYFSNVKFGFFESIISNMRNNGVSNVMNFKKYYHDWAIRYRRYSKNGLQFYFLLSQSICTLFVRKLIPQSLFNRLISLRINRTR